MKYEALFGWFDRGGGQEEDMGIPSIVTRADARNARRYLQEHSGFDFEKFDESIQVEELLNKPLGETTECLSAEEIAELVGSDGTAAVAAVFSTGLAARAITHSQHCDTCFENIELYQELKNRSVERAIEEDVEELTPLVSIGSVGRVEAVVNGDPRLRLALTMYCDALDFSGMGTMRACILGPFDTDAKDVAIHRVVPWHKRWFGVDAPFASMRKSSFKPIKGYYLTDPLVGFGQMQNNACGFVSIAQDIGGKEIISRGMIRCVVPSQAAVT
jgi:hypothetical protein